jgi:hypothetical protein
LIYAARARTQRAPNATSNAVTAADASRAPRAPAGDERSTDAKAERQGHRRGRGPDGEYGLLFVAVSMNDCALLNPDDEAAGEGAGSRWLRESLS